jgi:predicted GNAT family acetyltransferase
MKPTAMIPKTDPLPVTHNVGLRRFEVQAGGAPPAFLSYAHDGVRVVLEHTFVPEAMRGRGVAAVLVRAALDEARQRQWMIVPRCSYVARFIERHLEFADLVDPRVGDLD